MADITITEGDTLEVDYSLENTGDGTGEFDPRLLVQGTLEDQDTGITLDPAQTATGTLQWPTESGDAVTDALAEAVTDDTSDSITVTVESSIPPSGVSRWTFDDADTSSGTAIDVWGGNDGTINGATTGVAGANQTYTTNEAYSFDGTDDNVTAGSVSLSEFSLSLWINRNGGGGQNPRYISNAASSNGFELLTDEDYINGDTSPSFRVGDGSTFTRVDSSITLQNGTWYHLVGTYDGSTIRLYVDGSEVGSASSGYSNTNTGVTIGENPAAPGDDAFNGSIDDPRIYSKALTASEVSDLYNTGDIRG